MAVAYMAMGVRCPIRVLRGHLVMVEFLRVPRDNLCLTIGIGVDFSAIMTLEVYAALFRAILLYFAIWHIEYDTYLHLNFALDVIILFSSVYGFIAYLMIFSPKYYNLCTYYYDYKLSVLSFTMLCFQALFGLYCVKVNFGLYTPLW